MSKHVIHVTGSEGFIGKHLVSKLKDLGHSVDCLDTKLSAMHDITVAKNLMFQTDSIVIHLAAQRSVIESMKDPVQDASVNIMGTLNVLNACIASGVKRLIFASSAAVYGEGIWHKASSSVKPISCYGISKLTCEQYISMYSQLHKLQASILRIANVYGPGDVNGVHARFKLAAERDETAVMYGNGMQLRSYVHVDKVVSKIIEEVERDHDFFVLRNITGETMSLSQVACLYKTKTIQHSTRLGEPLHCTLDP